MAREVIPPLLQNCITAQDKATFVLGFSFRYEQHDNINPMFAKARLCHIFGGLKFVIRVRGLEPQRR